MHQQLQMSHAGFEGAAGVPTTPVLQYSYTVIYSIIHSIIYRTILDNQVSRLLRQPWTDMTSRQLSRVSTPHLDAVERAGLLQPGRQVHGVAKHRPLRGRGLLVCRWCTMDFNVALYTMDFSMDSHTTDLNMDSHTADFLHTG